MTGARAGMRLAAALGRLRRWRCVLVLAYHRIGAAETSVLDRSVFSADEETFDDQLRVLAREADVVDVADLRNPSRLAPGRRVAVTFDDGYRDAYTAAFPLLRAHGIPATLFLATGFLDDPTVAWWDELAWMARTSERDVLDLPGWLEAPLPLGPATGEAIAALTGRYKQLDAGRAEGFLAAVGEAAGTGRAPRDLAAELWLTWPMVREMRDAGMRFGGHTATHPVLTRVGPSRLRAEVRGCARRLREETGGCMTLFSYPVGRPDSFGPAARECLRDAGVELAFSCYGGASAFAHWDPYDVRRASPPGDRTRLRAGIGLPEVFCRW